MFNTPPPAAHSSRHLAVSPVRTRSARIKQQMNTTKVDPLRDVQSENLKKEVAEKNLLTERPLTDGHIIKKSAHCEIPVSTKKSLSSVKSYEARKKQLEYEAAQAEAQIQQTLIKKKLAADLAALEEKSRSRCSQHSEVDPDEKVQQWLERSHISDTKEIPREQQTHYDDGGYEIKNLVSAMYQANAQNKQLMSRLATSKDLPQYFGNPLDWQAFKQAYDESTKFCKYSDAENMWRLRKSLGGEAKETVSSLLIGNTAPHTVIEALELRYGRPETIINKIIHQLRKITPLPQNYHNDIVAFSIKIKNFVAAAQAVKQTDYLRSPELVSSVISKCPSALISKWADYYSTNYTTEKTKFEVLADFLYEEAKKISTAGLSHLYSQMDYRRKPDYRKHSALLSETIDNVNNCKFCHISKHKITECARFKRAMTKDRWRFVRVNRLCHKCLLTSHNRDTCSEPACGIDECSLPHHRLLHWKNKTSAKNNNSDSDSVNVKDCSLNSETVAHASLNPNSCVFLKVVPIKVRGPRGVFSTHALLDDGATVSLISADIADRAGLTGRKQTLHVRGAWNSELMCQSEIVNCKVSNTNNEIFELSARKINELNLPIQNLSSVNLKNFEHLKQLCNSITCSGNVKPKVLIGQDNYHLIAPIKTIINNKNEPCATLTPLGWCVHGVCPDRRHTISPECAMIVTARAAQCDSLYADDGRSFPHACLSAAATSLPVATHTGARGATADSPQPYHYQHSSCASIHTDCENDANLHELVRKSFMFESIGVYNKPRQNKNELKAIEIVDKSAKLIDGRWEVGLPWKDENAKMSDSYCNAYRRLKTVERKMSADKEYALRYKERVTHLLTNHYARKIELNEDTTKIKKIWYLPHFGVDNPNKKKMRLVCDAAATSAGQSLNDYLLPGPNLLESLLGIMLRFRERPIGLTGDIKDMFLRIKIRPQDQHAFRFLWRDNHSENVDKYVMTSLVFGTNCSPFIEQHIKNKNAQRYAAEMPEAVEAIVKNHFMDDYIDCFENSDTAVKRMKEVSCIHQQGGFEMRNWTSNDPHICQSMPKEILSAAAVRFKVEEDNLSERTLGLLWFPNTDTFAFNLSLHRIPDTILNCKKKPTKRQLLCIVMSIFDIYGLLAPFTMKAKIILQNCWKTNLKWDEEIDSIQFKIFVGWIEQLRDIKSIRIPRWYFRSPSSSEQNNTKDVVLTTARVSESLTLHVFCDAAPTGYCAVAYWRVQTNDMVRVRFIASRSRVAPIKPVTIPRLELQAAVLACRLADTVRKEHRLQPIKRYFWSDSMTVLHWIKNDTRNYNIFVANRLGEIDELCHTSEWHYIHTDSNIADVATKINTYKLHKDCEWFQGPRFLYEKSDDWVFSAPEKEKIFINENTLEKIHHVYEDKKRDIPVPDPDRFSSWLRLLRCTATVLLFTEKCKKSHIKEIDSEIMKRAEILLLRYSQAQSFATEIQLLKNNEQIAANSRLRTLTPYLDDKDLLRVGGRIGAASSVTSEMKNPVILDGRHTIARLIAKNYHERFAHSNNETVVNELRQKYWLLNLRPTVRTVASRCIFCRVRKAVPCIPRMADLPEARLAHHQRVFSHCGVDLFGAIEVTIGRRKERRYGVLFTCMTIRAVHIELVQSLTTDSFIMALRRMASRRGWPQYMYSDNGTNLRGAEKELKRSYQELDQNQVKDELTNRGVNWTFISPSSPHKGGAWERLIRSVKAALGAILKARAPREETLATLLAEIENIINSRPLTHVSVDPESMEALTPNHFLIGSTSNLPVPGVFSSADLYLRKMWRTAQRLTDMFWQRWMKEVLPTLIPRPKWYLEGGNLKMGDVVIIIDPNLPRNTWPKGIVVAAYPGKDGRIRTVDVKTKTGVLTRPVTRLALLPTAD